MISIVDDDARVREATTNLLRALGFTAATFASAEDFLGSERADDTACLIADVQLPGLSGIELQDRLRAEGKETPVIFITAFPADSVRTCALRGGAIGFLSKPFDTATLIDCIDKALHGRAT
jgi:FixJ family two-component response regulator